MFMELETLIPTSDPFYPYEVVGLLEGTNTIFISVSSVGLFALDLKSREVKKVGEGGNYYAILPYTSFYTPGTSLVPFFDMSNAHSCFSHSVITKFIQGFYA